MHEIFKYGNYSNCSFLLIFNLEIFFFLIINRSNYIFVDKSINKEVEWEELNVRLLYGQHTDIHNTSNGTHEQFLEAEEMNTNE